jgi:GntR family transcriptional regulator/MocR family aminotransferase
VIYVGSFSKTLSPALRLGFAAVPASLRSAVVGLRRVLDWQPPSPAQETLQRFIADGTFDQHLRRCRRVYRERHRLVAEFLDQLAADGWATALPSRAGLHATALLEPAIDEDTVLLAAAKRGIGLNGLSEFCAGTSPSPGLVVGFGAIATVDLPDALAALAGAVRSAGRRSGRR